MKLFVHNPGLKLQYRFNWRITAFSVICVTVFLNLSHWQIQRAEEKRGLQHDYERRRNLPAVAPGSLDSDKQYPAGQNLKLVGYYDNEHTFLLDNRVLKGKVGYEVISPMRLSTDSKWDQVLVNRGWTEMGPIRTKHVEIARIETEVEAEGWIYVPHGEMVTLARERADVGWPKVIQQLDFRDLIMSLDTKSRIFPYIVRLTESSPGALPRRWPVVNMLPAKHTGYAIQWFIMAIVVLVAYVWSAFSVQTKREVD